MRSQFTRTWLGKLVNIDESGRRYRVVFGYRKNRPTEATAIGREYLPDCCAGHRHAGQCGQ